MPIFLSGQHRFASKSLPLALTSTVKKQLSSGHERQQKVARDCLFKIFDSIYYLLRQGLALRGHVETEGNFFQLLRCFARREANLQQYMKRKTNFLSPNIQNEIIQLFSHNIVRKLASDVRKSGPFSVMVDGTQDVSGQEQESICIRYVDEHLNSHETFFGLYSVESTSGESISTVIFDVLIRLNLPLDNLRAQTYDGAANMSGAYRGCQAKVKEAQPLALHFHCTAHVVNLVMQHSVQASPVIRDALQWVHELGVLMKRSGKFRGMFHQALLQCDEDEGDLQSSVGSSRMIRPLCPTRWLCRLNAINSVIEQYKIILQALSELAVTMGDTAAKARGLLDKFEQGITYFALIMARKPIAVLEQLNVGMQARSANVSGMLKAAAASKTEISNLRCDQNFDEAFALVEERIEILDLEPLKLPRVRRLPKKFDQGGAMPQRKSPKEHYKPQYFQFLDAILAHLNDRLNSDNRDLQMYMALETMIVSGVPDESVLKKYQEIDLLKARYQLPMFSGTTNAKTLHEAQLAYQQMDEACRAMFSEVFIILKLLLVCPVSSCECERSFSALRRLKTFLRASSSQERVNHSIVCHMHKHELDKVDIQGLISEFISRSPQRREVFGSF